jgi:hypothetical protein
MALGFRDCCNNFSYFYLSEVPTFVSESEVYFIVTDDGDTFCAQYVQIPSLNYAPPTYPLNAMTLFTSCQSCTDTHGCPTVDPINQIGDLATVTSNECACKTQYPLVVGCYTINPTASNQNGGIAGLTFTGGVPPYRVFEQDVNGDYIQQNSYSNIRPNGVAIYSNVVGGTYYMKLIDGNGDEVFQNCSLAIPPGSLTLTSSVTNPNFFNATNGSITFTIGGGTSPYSVTYNGNTTQIVGNSYTIQNIGVGTYTISVTDSGTGVDLQTIPGSASLVNPPELSWSNTLCLSVEQCGVLLQLAFTKTSNYLNLRPIYTLNIASKPTIGLLPNTTFQLFYDVDSSKWVTTQINSFDNQYYNFFPPECQVGPQKWKFETNLVQNPLTSLPQNQTWTILPGNYLPNPTVTIGLICVPVLTSVVGVPSCAGQSNGSIQVIASGGVPPITFYATNGNGLISQSSNYFNQLSPGTYNVYVVDSSGTQSQIQTTTISETQVTTITMVNNCASTPLISEL